MDPSFKIVIVDLNPTRAAIAEDGLREAGHVVSGPVVVMIGRTFAGLAPSQGVATVGSSDSTFRISS